MVPCSEDFEEGCELFSGSVVLGELLLDSGGFPCGEDGVEVVSSKSGFKVFKPFIRLHLPLQCLELLSVSLKRPAPWFYYLLKKHKIIFE